MAGTIEKKKKGPNVIVRLYRETLAELRKVSWPTRQEAINLTIIVIIVMVAMSLFLFLVDFVAERLLSLGLNL